MKIIKPQSLGILHKPYHFLGRNYFVVSAIGFFRLGAENPRFLTENLQWPHVVASLPAGLVLDEVMPKQQAEVLLLGNAYSPNQKPVAQVHVNICVEGAHGTAGINKSLCVTGDREWRSSLLSRRVVTSPKPFTKMPLDYSRAEPDNQIGLLSPNQGTLANISYPASPESKHLQKNIVAGFGPIAIDNEMRKQKWGTYKQAWLKQDAPGFARDMDWSIFNMAPPDQWRTQFFHGGEKYCLQNLHPTKPIIQGELPKLQARAFIVKNTQTPHEAAEIAMHLDTVWFLPDFDLGVVIYHGQTEINDSDALDVNLLMIAYDDPQAPKSIEHYREVIALRTNKATATQHVFNDSQLAAAHSPEELARRAETQTAAEVAALAKSQKRLDLLDAQYWAKRGMIPPVGHLPPRATLPALGLMTAETARESDFDLSDIMAKAKALVAEAQENSKKALGKIISLPPQVVIPEEQLTAAITRGIVPAYDLLPSTETGFDPQFSHQLAVIERNYSEGEFASTEAYEAARTAVLKLPALRRQGRRAAPSVILSDLPLLPEVAYEFGLQIAQWKNLGLCLAGRDLAGAKLSGFDFSGADLREVMLEGADLSDAKFIGANLQGAALTGALLNGADFTNANLYQANLSTSQGQAVCFNNANLSYAHALNACWLNASLDGANLQRILGIKLTITGSSLKGACADKATLMEINADDTDWQGASLEKTVFLRAHLKQSNFTLATLCKTVLNEAQLQGSCWENASLDSIQGGGISNWSYANLNGMTAKKCGFHGANFAFANFKNSQLLRCDFGSCDFSFAVLDDALFSYPLFYKAQLQNVSAKNTEFFQALCRKTDFTGADLISTRFAQCDLSESIAPDGMTANARRSA
jgi:uncharacterized protein YjbI with pentapeptide repeats